MLRLYKLRLNVGIHEMNDLFNGVYRIPSNRLEGWNYSSPVLHPPCYNIYTVIPLASLILELSGSFGRL
jgi:hypothetical protein